MSLANFDGFFVIMFLVKTFSSSTQKIGKIGENIASRYLEMNGFVILERNYTKKWGEIDIVARKTGVIHFIEVKSVSHETTGEYRPEEQVHNLKQARLMRIIKTYISAHRIGEWQFDLVCVYLNHATRKAKVKFLENLIL